MPSKIQPFYILPLLVLVLASVAWGMNPHPRLMDPMGKVANWRAKACIDSMGQTIVGCTPDPDWATLKAEADAWKASAALGAANFLLHFEVDSATNANPAVFHTVEAMPTWSVFVSDDMGVCIGGATGGWAPINNPIGTREAAACHSESGLTRIDDHHFSLADINSTSYGSFTGQNIVVWIASATTANTAANVLFESLYSYRGSQYMQFVETMKIVREVLNDTSYDAAVLMWIDQMNAMGAVGICGPTECGNVGASANGYANRNAVAFPLAFDWWYSQLSPSQIAASVVTMNLWWDQFSTNYQSLYGCDLGTVSGCGKNLSRSNFTLGHFENAFAISLASYGDNPRDSGASNSDLDTTLTNWNAQFGLAMQTNGFWTSGHPAEGVNYSDGDMQWIGRILYMLYTAGEGDLNFTAWTKAVVKENAYELHPDRWTRTQEGQGTGNFNGVLYGTQLYTLASLLQGTTEGQWSQWMYANLNTATGCNIFTASAYTGCINTMKIGSLGVENRFFWWDPTQTAADYRSALPTYYMSPGDWHLFTRTDWTDSAIWESYHGQQSFGDQSHGYKHAGDIEIWRGSDPLIVTANGWENVDGHQVVSGSSYNTDSLAADLASTLFFCDSGAYTLCTSGVAYSGGQDGLTLSTNTTAGAQIPAPAYHVDANYRFAEQDLANAYQGSNSAINPTNRTLRYWKRKPTFFPDGTAVIQDLTLVSNSSYTQKIRWVVAPDLNTPTNPPVNSSGVVKASSGTSSVFIIPLFASGTPSITISNGVPATALNTKTYQVDVTNSIAATTLQMLTVLYPGASGASAPTVSAISTIDAGFQGLEIKDGAPKVVVMPTVVDASGNTYTSHTVTSLHFTSTFAGTGKYVTGGLASGLYSITIGGVSDGTCTVGTDGSCYFAGASGAVVLTQTATGPTITTASLPNAPWNTAYSQTLTESGGTAPFSYSVTGSLPVGLSLNTSTGVISGTPGNNGTLPATVSFTITVTDANSLTASQALSITVTDPSPISINSATLPSAGQGLVYTTTTLGATCASCTTPYTWSVCGASLPPNLSLSSGGVISGTTSATATIQTWTFTVCVQSADTYPVRTDSHSFSIVVYDPNAPQITTTGLPSGTVNVAYATTTMTASGGTTPYTWAATGSIPPGLNMSNSGVWTGTPTTSGSYSVTVTVTDSSTPVKSSSAPFAITVNPAGTLTVTDPLVLPVATDGLLYSYALNITGGTKPYACSKYLPTAAGFPPPGITLNANCTLNGTTTVAPQACPAAPFYKGSDQSNFYGYTSIIKVTDSATPTPAVTYVNAFCIPVSSNSPATFTPISIPSATVGFPYAVTFTASNFTGNVSWAIINGTIPPGLNGCNNSTGTTCNIAGTPTSASGSPYNFTLQASDGTSLVTQTYVVPVTQGSAPALSGSMVGTGTVTH